MKKLEFTVISYLNQSDQEKEQEEKLRDLGLPVEEADKEERLTAYVCMPDKIVEYRETLVKYKGELHPAAAILFMTEGKVFETPILLTTITELEEKITEYYESNQKNT